MMKKVIYKFLIVLIIFICLGIIGKSNSLYKEKIHYYLYEDNLAFSNFRSFYNKYLGDIFPLNNVGNNTVSVFSENIKYLSMNKYYDGVALKVADNYLVPALKDGIVTYVGEKENYGNVVIIMGNDGVSIWYGNISNSSFKLYDSVKVGDLVGEVKNNKLYLAFFDGDEFLDYDFYMNKIY